jgi:hypothetical protein
MPECSRLNAHTRRFRFWFRFRSGRKHKAKDGKTTRPSRSDHQTKDGHSEREPVHSLSYMFARIIREAGPTTGTTTTTSMFARPISNSIRPPSRSRQQHIDSYLKHPSLGPSTRKVSAGGAYGCLLGCLVAWLVGCLFVWHDRSIVRCLLILFNACLPYKRILLQTTKRMNE